MAQIFGREQKNEALLVERLLDTRGHVRLSGDSSQEIVAEPPGQTLVNGQWLMVNACTPQGEPIFGTGGEKQNYIMYIVLDRLLYSFHIWHKF